MNGFCHTLSVTPQTRAGRYLIVFFGGKKAERSGIVSARGMTRIEKAAEKRGSGEPFDPYNTVPVHAGSYIIDHARKVHHSRAKNEEAIIQLWGMRPATSTLA